MRIGWAAVGAAMALAGCDRLPNPVVSGSPPALPYAGSLTARATQALECDGKPYDGGTGYYDSGLASVQGDATAALKNYFREEFSQVPRRGYRIEAKRDGRVLFSYDVNGLSKVVFIAADDIRDFNDDTGWGIDSWAECDPAELPASVTDELGLQVWQDDRGRRVPITKVMSLQGSEHCDWQQITFLWLGRDKSDPEFVRDTTGELAEFLRTTYAAHATVPADARDTGFLRDGNRLWLAKDGSAAYLVKVDNPGDVERWPASKRRIGCA